MSKFRRSSNRSDENQDEIVKALRGINGVSVEMGHDDILVGYKGRNYWIELKNPEAISNVTGQPMPSKIRKSQYKIRETWCGQYDIAWTLEQILKVIGIS